ncbi:hypothetical protein BDW66DRAFT_160478 [Aspergillus desertorum]
MSHSRQITSQDSTSSSRVSSVIRAQNDTSDVQLTGMLRLRAEGDASARGEEMPARHIRWSENVVDNEGMGKKSSKGTVKAIPKVVRNRNPRTRSRLTLIAAVKQGTRMPEEAADAQIITTTVLPNYREEAKPLTAIVMPAEKASGESLVRMRTKRCRNIPRVEFDIIVGHKTWMTVRQHISIEIPRIHTLL